MNFTLTDAKPFFFFSLQFIFHLFYIQLEGNWLLIFLSEIENTVPGKNECIPPLVGKKYK